jgi:hypothetical protein
MGRDVARRPRCLSLIGMPRPAVGQFFRRYAVTWIYLALFGAAEISYALLSHQAQLAVLHWTSTSVHNLEHHPVGCLVASAFIPTSFISVWPLIIAVALLGANHVLGNWRTLLTCGAGHIVGTVVSEGIVAYRIAHGALPGSDRYLIDVGPSYIVVAAIAAGLLWGTSLIRAAAALDFLLLIFVGDIFTGLGTLQLAAVGHLTALITGAAVSTALVWRRKART